jgi:hypothetical protein
MKSTPVSKIMQGMFSPHSRHILEIKNNYMKITSYIETYYDQKTDSIKTRRVYVASYKDLFAYGVTASEALSRIFYGMI